MRNALTPVALPVMAILAALLVFGVMVAFAGVNPLEVWTLLFQGAFGSWFAWQNTLQRAAPLMLTALCVAIPARAGLVIIGGEGALVLGGLACAVVARSVPLPDGLVGSVVVCLAGALAGALWIALAGWLRQYRGINETISSLLLAYIAIGFFKHLVEGPMRDPASLNKPATYSLSEGLRIGGIAGSEVHWGLVLGVVACVVLGIWLRWAASGFAIRVVGGNLRTAQLVGLRIGGIAGSEVHWGLVLGVVACVVLGIWLRWAASGFAIRVVGGNLRTAQLVGLPASSLVIAACALGGACAGLAGAVEVAAVHTNANASLIAFYGYAGILVSFIARHNPIAIIPVAILFGGFGAAGSLLQRRLGLPDASVLVLQGIAFVFILASEALRDVDWKTLFAKLAKLAGPAPQAPAAAPTPTPEGNTP